MYKKLALSALILTLSISAAACSSDNKTSESASPAATVAPTTASAEDASLYQAKAYIAGRLAEEKITQLFTKETTEDGKPVLTSSIAKSKEEATEFLNAYLDPALTEKVLAHYLTEEKAGEAIVVKADPFVPASILATASQEEVTFSGTADEVKMTLKDGGVYTAKKNAEGNYIISDIAK
ncbi:hypothetical protein [Gorillibacterium sp. CAU 1737]|uniref:hypothetical protein n=1 Tax=Gorillibacterium sp. CAU 1737 TaxID=3140362 RepID=UPI003261C168